MKIKLFLTTAVLCLVTGLGLASGQVMAQTADDETTASSSADTTQNLKSRIERIVKEKQDQIKGVIDNLSFQKKGFIGQVERIAEESLTIETIKGTQIISITDQVELIKNNKPIKLTDLEVDNWVIVMGYIDDDDSLIVRRIVVSSESLRPHSYFVQLGTIQDLTKTKLSFTPRSGEAVVEMAMDKTSAYQDYQGKKLAVTDLTENLQVLVIYYQDNQGFHLKTLRLLSSLEDANSDL